MKFLKNHQNAFIQLNSTKHNIIFYRRNSFRIRLTPQPLMTDVLYVPVTRLRSRADPLVEHRVNFGKICLYFKIFVGHIYRFLKFSIYGEKMLEIFSFTLLAPC